MQSIPHLCTTNNSTTLIIRIFPYNVELLSIPFEIRAVSLFNHFHFKTYNQDNQARITKNNRAYNSTNCACVSTEVIKIFEFKLTKNRCIVPVNTYYRRSNLTHDIRVQHHQALHLQPPICCGGVTEVKTLLHLTSVNNTHSLINLFIIHGQPMDHKMSRPLFFFLGIAFEQFNLVTLVLQ